MPNNQGVENTQPQMLSVSDILPNNQTPLTVSPNNLGDVTGIADQQYPLTLGAGMLIPLGYLTYPVSQTIISPKSP